MGDNIVTRRIIETLLLDFPPQFPDNANIIGRKIRLFAEIRCRFNNFDLISTFWPETTFTPDTHAHIRTYPHMHTYTHSKIPLNRPTMGST